MQEPYFENVINVGNLYLYKTLNTYENEAIVFICTDEKKNYYFCVCYEIRYKLAWVIANIEKSMLEKVLEKSIDMHSVYRESNLLIHILFENSIGRSEIVNYSDIYKFCPTEGVVLKTEN